MKDDPHDYTLGAQHDARLLPDGTLTVFDNRTKLPHRRRGRCATGSTRGGGTATLLQSITDPDVTHLELLRLGSAPAESETG